MNKYEQLAKVYEEIKQYVDTHNIVFITAAQACNSNKIPSPILFDNNLIIVDYMLNFL